MKRDDTTVWEFVVHWGNPYSDPPEGVERVIARTRITTPRGAGAPPIPDEILHRWHEANRAFAERLPIGDAPRWPWSISVSEVQKTRRTLSDRAKHRRRLAALVRRMQRRFPLVAETMIRAVLEQKPAYYGLTLEQARQWRLEDDA